MITFFQKHKTLKNIIYSVVVITFVGAGFVGYGNVSLNDKNVLLSIDDKDFRVIDVSREMNLLAWNKFNNFSGNETMKRNAINSYIADNKEELKKVALESLVKKYRINTFANELFLSVSNKEIYDEVIKDVNFRKENKFDKETYKKILNRAGYTPKEYESKVRDILLNKKLNLFFMKGLKPTDTEIILFDKVISFYKDCVAEIIPINSLYNDYNLSDEEHKLYWSENKEKYINRSFLDVAVISLNRDVNESVSDFKRRSLKKSIWLKKNLNEFSGIKNQKIYDNDKLYSFLKSPVEGKVFKPFFDDDSALIIKINKINKASIQSFDEAFDASFVDAKNNKIIKIISKEFETKNINNAKNYIGRISTVSSIPVELSKKVNNVELATKIYKYLNLTEKIKETIVIDGYIINYMIIDTGIVDKADRIVPTKEMLSDFLFSVKRELYLQKYIKNY